MENGIREHFDGTSNFALRFWFLEKCKHFTRDFLYCKWQQAEQNVQTFKFFKAIRNLFKNYENNNIKILNFYLQISTILLTSNALNIDNSITKTGNEEMELGENRCLMNCEQMGLNSRTREMKGSSCQVKCPNEQEYDNCTTTCKGVNGRWNLEIKTGANVQFTSDSCQFKCPKQHE